MESQCRQQFNSEAKSHQGTIASDSFEEDLIHFSCNVLAFFCNMVLILSAPEDCFVYQLESMVSYVQSQFSKQIDFKTLSRINQLQLLDEEARRIRT